MSGPAGDPREEAARFEGALLELLGDLVNLGGYTESREELLRKAERLERELSGRGLEVTREEGELGPHLVARNSAAQAGKFTLLLGHYDTVAPPVPGGHRLSLEGNLVRGRAVADMTGGIVTILGALELLGKEGALGGIPLEVILVSDEERGSGSAIPLLKREGARAERALVFEPGREETGVVLGRKGRRALEITVHGREAHAGIAPETGINALAEAASILGPAEEKAKSLEVTLVIGGRTEVLPGVPNTVPGKVVMSGDLRYHDEGAARALIEDLGKLVNVTPARMAGAALPGNRVEVLSGRPAWVVTREDRLLFERAREIVRELGFEIKAVYAGGGSDANHMAELGVPVLDGLGPVGGNFHREDEFLLLPTLLQRVLLAEALLRDFARDPDE